MFKNSVRVLESIAKEFIERKDKRFSQELLEILLKSYDTYFYKNKADDNLKEDRYQYKLMLVDNLFKEPLDQLQQLFRDFIKAELTNVYQEKLSELKQQNLNQNEIQFLKQYFSFNYNKQMKSWEQEQSMITCFLISSEEINKFTNSLRKQFADQLKKGSVLIPSSSSTNSQLQNTQPNIPATINSYQQNSISGVNGEKSDQTKIQQKSTTQSQFINNPSNNVASISSQQVHQTIKDGNIFGGNQLELQPKNQNTKPQQISNTAEMRKEGENHLNENKSTSEKKFSRIPIPPSFNPAAAVGQIIQPANQFDPSAYSKKIINNNNNSSSTNNMNNSIKQSNLVQNNANIPKQIGSQENFETGYQKANQPIEKNEMFPISKVVEIPSQTVNQINKGNQNTLIKTEIIQEKTVHIVNPNESQKTVVEQRKLLMRKIKPKAVPDQVSFTDLIQFLSYPHIPEVFDIEAKLMGLEIEDKFSDLQATQLLILPPQSNQEVNQASQVVDNSQKPQNSQRKPNDSIKFTLQSNNQNQSMIQTSNNQSQNNQVQLIPKNNQIPKSDNSQNNNFSTQKQEQRNNLGQQGEAKKMIQENVIEMTQQQKFGKQETRLQEPFRNNSHQVQGNQTQNKNMNTINGNQIPINNFNSNNSNGNTNINSQKPNQQMNQHTLNQFTQISDKKIVGNSNNNQQNNNINIRGHSQQINNQLNHQIKNQSTNINQISLQNNNKSDPQISVVRKNNEQPQQQYQQQINQQKQQQMQSQLQQYPQQRINQMPTQRQNTQQQSFQQETKSYETLGSMNSVKQPNNEQYVQKIVEGNYQQQQKQSNSSLALNQNTVVNSQSNLANQNMQYPSSSQAILGNMNQISAGENQSVNSYPQPQIQGNKNPRNNLGNNTQSYNSQNQNIYQANLTSEINQNNTSLIQQRDQSGYIDSNQAINQRQSKNYLSSSNQINNLTNNKGNLPIQEQTNQQKQTDLNDQASFNNLNQSSLNNNQGYYIEKQDYQFQREQTPEQFHSHNAQNLQQQFLEQPTNSKTYFNTQKNNNLGVSNYFEDPNQLQSIDYPQKQQQLGTQYSDQQEFETIKPFITNNANNIGSGMNHFQNGFDDSANPDNNYHHNLQNSQIRQSNLSLGGTGEASYLQSSQQQIIGDNGYNSHLVNENLSYLQEEDSMINKSYTHQVNENYSMIGSIPEFNIGSHNKMSSDSKNTNVQGNIAPSSSSRFQSDLPVPNPIDFIAYENNNFHYGSEQGIQSQKQGIDQQPLQYFSGNNNDPYSQQEQIPQLNMPLAETIGNFNGNLENQILFQNNAESNPSDLVQNWQHQQQQQKQQFFDGFASQAISAPQREEDIFAFPQTSDVGKDQLYFNPQVTNRNQDMNPSKEEQSTPQYQQRETGSNNMKISGVFSLSNSLKSNSLGDQNTANQNYLQQQIYPKNNYQTKQKPFGTTVENQLGYSHDNLGAANPNRIELIEARGPNSRNSGSTHFQNVNNNLEMNSTNNLQYQEERNIINNSYQNVSQSISQAFNQGVQMLATSNGENQQNQNQLPSGNFYDYQQQPNQRNITIQQQGISNQPQNLNENKLGHVQQNLPQSQQIQGQLQTSRIEQPFQEYQQGTGLSSSSLNSLGNNQFQQIQMQGFNGPQVTKNYGSLQNSAFSSSTSGNISFLNYQKTSNDKVQVYRQNQDIENDSPDFKIINAAFQCGQYSKEYQDQIRKEIKQFKQVKQNIILEVQEFELDPTCFIININDEKHKNFGNLKILVSSTQLKMVDFSYFKKARDILSGVNTNSKLIELIKIWWRFQFSQENKKKNSTQTLQPPQLGSF